MPEITDLRAGDPVQVEDYRLVGRLGPGVYLARSPARPPTSRCWCGCCPPTWRPGRERASWVRDPATGAFAFFGDMQEPIVSPGGGYVASLPVARMVRTDFETVVLRDRVTGWSGEVRTVDKPATLLFPAWSEDGRRLLATALDTSRRPAVSLGFVVLDAARRSVTFSPVQGAATSRSAGARTAAACCSPRPAVGCAPTT
ncbi:hypothetical protein AB0L44_33425 [Nonomuraea wenchangensis]|uniref:hypothetical protein n=1 Tax=Nonomuraea wenchangensis TaxID=568860 RepID=UPI003444055A